MTPAEIALAIKVATEHGHHPIEASVTAGDVLQEIDTLIATLKADWPTILAVLKALQALRG